MLANKALHLTVGRLRRPPAGECQDVTPTQDGSMKRISSKDAIHLKKIFPVFWLGILAAFTLFAWRRGGVHQDVMFLAIPCALAVLGLVLTRILVWNLVDEVYDCGDYLLVKSGRVETQIPLSEIMNVSTSIAVNPPRITLHLAADHGSGVEVKFTTPRRFTLNPFAKNQIAEDIMARAFQARSGRAV